MATYYVGDTVRLAVAFRNPANALVDPSSVTLSISIGNSTTVLVYPASAGMTRTSTGNYSYNLTLTTLGELTYTWAGTGAVAANRTGGFDVLSARTSPASFWSPANDHLVFDSLETLVLTRLDGSSQTLLRCLRLPANLQIGEAGAMRAYGTQTDWNIWIQECPTAPEINAKLTDAYGKNYRIDEVVQSVVLNMWEIKSTADAGVGL